jgi:Zn-dependent protease
VPTTAGERPRTLSTRCARCGTELAPTLLSCPACNTLVHAERLKQLAAAAEKSQAEGQLAEANASWHQALELLPPTSQQFAAITQRVEDITKQLASEPGTSAILPAAAAEGPWYKRGWAIVATIGVVLLGKLKFLLLGLTKLKTFLSMFAFFGVYWSTYGWPLALGLVVSIYIHEMGHVSELKRLGIAAGAPLFIPGIGALVMLKQRITDPSVDARIGLAGPVWGLGAGIAAFAVYLVTGSEIWGAIAQLTGFINLFNLIPIWQLDGSRGFHALAQWQRIVVLAAIAGAYYVTAQKMLLIVGAVALFRAFRKTETEPDYRAMATYVVLVFALGWLSVSHLAP